MPSIGDARAKKPTLRQRVDAFKGHHIDEAVERLGLPTSQTSMLGLTVYSWTVDNVLMGWPTGDEPLKCTIRLAADASGAIARADVDGNRGACQVLEKRLAAPRG